MNTGIIIGGIYFIIYFVGFLLKIDLSRQLLLNKYILRVVGVIGMVIGYSFLTAMVSGSRDFQVVKSYLSFLLFYIPGAFGIIHLLKKYYSAKEIIHLVVLVTVLQALVILAMFTNPAVKGFLFSLLRDAGNRADQNITSGGFRFLGFSFGTTWDLSIVQSVGVMCIALLCRIDRTQINFKNTLFFLLLCLTVFLSGRTGILGIILGVVMILIPLKWNEIPLYRFLKFSFLLLAITLPLYFLVIRLIPAEVVDIVENNVVPWAFEMFQNDKVGLLETRSSNELQTMYFMPSFWTMLFGDGYYINPGDPTMYYMNTDAGYMRHILFYGITGSILQLSIYFLVFYQMLKFSYLLHSSAIVKIFLSFLLVYLLLSHMKGDLLMGADMPIKLIFLLYAMFISFHSSKEDSITDKIKN